MKHFSLLKHAVVLGAVLISLNVAAQQFTNVIASKKTIDGRFNFLKFDATAAVKGRSSSTTPDDIKKTLGLGAKHSLVADAAINNNAAFRTDQQGEDHVRYKQYFNGVEVEYAVVTLHSKNGALNALSGDYYNIDESFSTSPALSEKTAFNRAIAFVGAKKYSWDDNSLSNPAFKNVPKGELVICRNYMQEDKVKSATPLMELAYKFAIYAIEPLRYDYIYVSARTGDIIHVNPIIKHVDGTAATRYSGSKTIATTKLSDGTYALKDSGGNYNIATYNLARGYNYNSAPVFTDNDNNWTAAEYNNTNLDNAALDAHWGAMKTLDYWRTVHGRSSFDNKGSRINSYVHYGTYYANAFWDGYEMTYGDGNGGSMSALTSIDICGHEIGHGVCEYTANLIYSYESGAINEGFSDIWGACIKKYADPSKNIWLTGDEISSTGTPFRSMSNPKSQGQPDTYKGSYWYTGGADNGGVHYNSGVMNHWFYILTEGKTGTNDRGTSYKVTGIGITKAAQIAYRAENLYLFPNAAYADTRIATVQAAEDLFGANSSEVIQTTEAWNAVGVNEALARPDSVTATFANKSIAVKWNVASTKNIAGFKVERSLNGINSFLTIGSVGATARSYTDTNYINNSLNQYRVRSFKDSTTYSDYSSTASVAVGNAPLIMTSGSYTTCSATFFDPGGQGPYSPGYTVMTLRPETVGSKLQVGFTIFYLYYYDNLYVYNGPSTSSPLLGVYSGSNLPPILQSTATNGELTFSFNASSGGYPGWKANVSCYKPVTAPSNLAATVGSSKDVHLSWTDNAPDETRYVVERSLNDTVNFQAIVNLPANTTTYVDTAAADNSYSNYRVRAYRDSVSSPPSNTANVTIGSIYTMQNGSVTTCGATFLDPGGSGPYTSGRFTETFRPATSGNKLKVVFNQFNTSYDYLYVYNGPNSSSPLLGSYSGTNLPPNLYSTAPGGELTFVFNPYSTSNGWTSYISCYKPVGTPGNLTATKNNEKYVQLNWTDSANDETGYIVERSINDSLHYTMAVFLPANSVSYLDTTAPDNSFIYYRVKATRDNLSSAYSNEVSITNGNFYVMRTGTFNTCNVMFLDPGGFSNYDNNVNYTTTFRPATAGNKLRVAFSQFQLESCCDYLRVYDGPSTSSPSLGIFNGSTMPPVMVSTAPNGELTFQFTSDGSSVYPGWQASINCFKPVARPSGLKAVLNASQRPALSWTDNGDDETRYAVERSINGTSSFSRLVALPAHSAQYVDSSAPSNSLLYYRISAYHDTIVSVYSDTANLVLGNPPFIMKDSTVITCDKIFMDPGGSDVIPYGSYYNIKATFKPATAGNNIGVAFSKFRLNGYLYVYNGSSTSSPLLASLSGYNPNNPVFNSTATDGALTFIYQGYSYSDSGWVAQVNCYKPVAKPSGVKAVVANAQVGLSWTDNADDETRYVVERSVNASSLFTSVAQLPANTTQYVDSAAPANSLLYYRVRAYRDTLSSLYSDTAMVTVGNSPFLMKDSTVVTCDKVFMDPAGADVIRYTGNYYYITSTFKPAINGNNIKAVSSKFSLNGSLYVYNGSSINSPMIGYYNGTSANGMVFNGTGTDGSLTFLYQGYGGDSGWVAQISCYKPIAKPTGLKAVTSSSQVSLSWNDNADDETRYVVERSVNASSMFTSIAQLPANTTRYVDSAPPANSLFYYRIKAYRDTLSSFYSDTASLEYGNAPLIMKDTILVTCDKVFLDVGGADVIPPNVYYNKTTTFRPAVSGNNIKVAFSKFRIAGTLYIYNGSSVNSPFIGAYSTNIYPPSSPSVLNGTNADGSLTFVYQGYAVLDSGWVAQVSCYKPVAKPTGLKAVLNNSRMALTWSDNAEDETRYVVERSVNASSLFTSIAQLPANTNQYVDSAAPDNSLLYYRVRAYRDTLGSFYSDTAMVTAGNSPFLMKDSTVVTCDKVFMDPAGADVIRYTGNYYYTTSTFRPAINGNNIRAVFSKFSLNGTLYVYNGPSINSPLIGSYYGTSANGMVFNGTGNDGSLTFLYQGYGNSDSGWVAQISCYKPVAKPSGLRTMLNGLQVNLTWNDNADNETRYVVERSVNGSSLFTPVAQLPANTTQYTDTAVADSYLYYRVRAYTDTTESFYSDTALVAVGNVPFLMKDSTLITCAKVFMDPGGADVIPANNYYYYNLRSTFKPGVTGNNIKVAFSKIRINGTLSVYDGPSTSSPLISSSSYYYYSTPPVFKASGPDGSLTFVYQGYSYSDSGWVAAVSCYKPITAPSGLYQDTTSEQGVKMRWTDNANNETGYVVERSVIDSLHFETVAYLPANTATYTDSAAPANSFMYYRVKAYIDSSSSDYSNKISVFTGSPFLMSNNTTLTTCGRVFLDPGGQGYYSSGYYTTTIKPTTAGNVVRVQFSEFNVNYDNLTVYNGASASSPVLGSYSYTNTPPLLQSTAPGGELTFVLSAYNSYASPGWVAYVSCFKPVFRPTSTKAVADSVKGVKVTWSDNAQDETRYVVERSVNATTLFVPVAQLTANSTAYTDSSAPANSLLYYRVKAFRDTTGSTYSDTASIAIGNAPFIMKDSTLITCSKLFMDPGGVDVIPSNIYYNTYTTFKPGVSGNNIKVTFSKIAVNGYLSVFNGSSTNSPLIGSYRGFYNNLPAFNSTASDGSLTFAYSGYSYADSGWVADVSCFKPVAKPTAVRAVVDTASTIQVSWSDNATDETRYVVERSVNAPAKYVVIATLPSNSTAYIDSSASANSLLFYRVRAYRDSSASNYSDTATVALGNAPYLIKDSTLITCSKVFMDPGGVDVIPSNIYYSTRTTFKPGATGNSIKVAFSKLSINGYLYVYNGSSVNSPLIGQYGGYYGGPVTVTSTATDGSLTFVYSGYSYSDSGWLAQVSCLKQVARPTGVSAVTDTSAKIKITWNDNADDETKYVVERSINAKAQFKTIAQLSANAVQFIDSSATPNTLMYYRVRAYRDTASSFYSDTAVIAFGSAPYIPAKDSTLITCSKVFLDPGGVDAIPTGYYNMRTTFTPGTSGNNIKVAFSKLIISGTIYVYNGSSVNSPLIGLYGSGYNNGLPNLTSSAADGSLTLVYSGYSYSDEGWQAQVSCVKQLARPTGVSAVADTSSMITVSWTDNANDETRYVVERAANTPFGYLVVAQLPSNTSRYSDSTAPSNSLLYYRVRAYRDTEVSTYSDTATVAKGNAPFIMKDTTLFTCDKVFLDPGGIDVIPQSSYNYIRTTFKPGVAGNNIKAVFSKLRLSGTLYVFDGSSTNSPVIGSLSSYYSTIPAVFTATGPEGSLTFLYIGSSYNDSGWVGQISCFKPVSAPTHLVVTSGNQKNVQLKWNDEANDETKYVVERSFNDAYSFTKLTTLPANSTTYTDTSAPENSYVYYRVTANRDSVASPYSNSVSVINGVLFAMRNGTISGCGITLLDPGGAGNYGNNLNYTTTVLPSSRGMKVRATFSEFNTESCCDYLNVYNGPDTFSPLIGTYLGSDKPPVLQSSAANGELTFVFVSDGATTGTGWAANISCIQVSDTIATCSTDSLAVNTIQSNITGSSYQWQKYTGRGFGNIYDDTNNSGTTTATLAVKNAAIGALEIFRCIVDGNTSNEFVVLKANRWIGSVSSNWHDAANWSCGKVPDANTDVLIEGGRNNDPVLNSNGECRSVRLLYGAILNISAGRNLNIRR